MTGYVNERDGYRVLIPELESTVECHGVLFKAEKLCSAKDKSGEEDALTERVQAGAEEERDKDKDETMLDIPRLSSRLVAKG